MINILSFFRKKINIYFLIIITIISLFNSIIYYKYVMTDKKLSDDENIYMIVDEELYDVINKKDKIINEYKIDDSLINKHVINYDYNKKYFKIKLDRISLYEKYKDKATLLAVNKYYDDTINSLNFYKIILNVLLIISIIILIIIIFSTVYYEKNNIKLLNMIGYKRGKIIKIYLINLIILILPSLLFYLITYLIL